MLKFGLKIKQRRQVQLRYFAKHYRSHVKVIEEAFLKYLKKKHQTPISVIHAQLYSMYLRFAVKELLSDLRLVKGYMVQEEEKEMERIELMKRREKQEWERKVKYWQEVKNRAK